MKILIVDDSSVKRKALAHLIEKEGHEVIEAGDGQDGLEKARADIPDLIVSDILMPRMDGFNFLRNIKKDERLKTIPFFFYSANYQGEKEREFALSLGASGFIEDLGKPEGFWQELQEIIAGGKGLQFSRPIIEGDEKFLENYGHIVATKLEEKVRELEDEVDKRRRTEEALRESEEKFSRAFHSSPAMIALAKLDGRLVDVNKSFADFYGYPREEILGKTVVELQIINEDERQKMLELARKGGGSVHNAEIEIQLRDGGHHHMLVSLDTFPIGGVPHRLATLVDITERKRGEEELRLLYILIQDISLSEDFRAAIEITLRKICVAAGWAMGSAWVPSADGSHLECSPAWYGGYDGLRKFREISKGFKFLPGMGLPGRSWSSKKPVWVRDVTLDSNFPRADYAREAGLKGAMSIPILAGDEVVAVMDFFVQEPKEEDRRLIELVSTVAAYLGVLFQRKEIEGEFRKLYHAVQQSPVSIFITDATFNIQYINPKFIEVTGYSREEAIGKKPDIISSGAAMISDTEWRGEFLARKKNGDPFWEYATISPVRNTQGEITNFIGIHEDITERRKLEDQLRHSQKLEALGQLVGGIAHDFNNMLTAIIGYAGILQMKMSKDDPLMVNVEQVLEAAERGATLTRSLLVFGRKQAIFPRPLNLNEVVEKVEKLLLRLIGEDIELRTVIADKELNVTADPLQIEQVLINLATNARDAMSKEGVLTIETGREEIDKKLVIIPLEGLKVTLIKPVL